MRTIIISALLLPFTATAATYEYTVSIDADLSEMTVRAKFSQTTRWISARDENAGLYLIEARNCETGARLDARGRRLRIASPGIRCLKYKVDLARAARTERRNEALDETAVAISPSLWMWRPGLNAGSSVIVEFELPGDMQVSVPWASLGERRFRFGLSPRSGQAVSIFGDFNYMEREVGDATLRIAMLQLPRGEYDNNLADWVVDTATSIADVYGRFPNPSPQILVVPVGASGWGSSRAVPFGRVIRDGGETIELFINHLRPLEEFYEDWTATHEFSHLLLPYVTTKQRWVSEGFAGYYQNVILARTGIYDPTTAWQKLYDGMDQGRRTRPNLSPNEASAEGIWQARMKIYWSGAAIALMADVEIRRRSEGTDSLDKLLGRLQSCCLPSDRVWTAMELFRQLDRLLDEPLFVPLYRDYADTAGFPEYRPLLKDLGIEIRRDRVFLSDNAALAEIRDAITGGQKQEKVALRSDP